LGGRPLTVIQINPALLLVLAVFVMKLRYNDLPCKGCGAARI